MLTKNGLTKLRNKNRKINTGMKKRVYCFHNNLPPSRFIYLAIYNIFVITKITLFTWFALTESGKLMLIQISIIK